MKAKKIIIFGLTASGKTTLAKRLSKKTKIPYYSTDDMVYKVKWTKKYTEKESSQILNKIIKRKEWIIEGVHCFGWVVPAIESADKIILLDMKKKIMRKRVLKRKRTLLQKIKLLYWVYRWGVKDYQSYKEKTDADFIELKNEKEVENFLKNAK